ncbi:MAG: hypothetical protein U0Q12_27850 [Vicinamibacterales bacterium]
MSHPVERSRLTAALVLFLAALSGCGGGSSTSPLQPTAVAASTTVDTFTGQVTSGGVSSQPFTVTAPGTITIAITAITPLSSLTMGIGLGVWDGSTCSVSLTSSSAHQGDTFSATTSSAGNYCVALFDVGNILPDVTVGYEMTVTHT